MANRSQSESLEPDSPISIDKLNAIKARLTTWKINLPKTTQTAIKLAQMFVIRANPHVRFPQGPPNLGHPEVAEAFLAMSRGRVMIWKCMQCATGKGIWEQCVVVDGLFDGACANCHAMGKDRDCTCTVNQLFDAPATDDIGYQNVNDSDQLAIVRESENNLTPHDTSGLPAGLGVSDMMQNPDSMSGETLAVEFEDENSNHEGHDEAQDDAPVDSEDGGQHEDISMPEEENSHQPPSAAIADMLGVVLDADFAQAVDGSRASLRRSTRKAPAAVKPALDTQSESEISSSESSTSGSEPLDASDRYNEYRGPDDEFTLDEEEDDKAGEEDIQESEDDVRPPTRKRKRTVSQGSALTESTIKITEEVVSNDPDPIEHPNNDNAVDSPVAPTRTGKKFCRSYSSKVDKANVDNLEDVSMPIKEPQSKPIYQESHIEKARVEFQKADSARNKAEVHRELAEIAINEGNIAGVDDNDKKKLLVRKAKAHQKLADEYDTEAENFNTLGRRSRGGMTFAQPVN